MKPKSQKDLFMFANPIHRNRPRHATRFERSVSPMLRHLNACTLAVALIIALALLTSIRGKELEKGSAIPKNTKAEVVIEHFNFSPQTLTVGIGTTVTWTNHDSVPHMVVSAQNQFKKSPVLKPGQGFSNTFTAAGTYSYACSIHPRMTGQVIVK